MNKLKENSIVKQIKNAEDRKNLHLGQIEYYKKILFVCEKEKESYKANIQVNFPSAKIHHLYIRPIKEDRTIGHNYSVHDSDFNLTGKLKNDKLRLLEKTSFDLILDLSDDSILLNYFICKTPSRLIIGKIDATNTNLHDISIEYGNNDDEFLKNINNQIRLLTENGNK